MTDPRSELKERLASAGWLAWPETRTVFAALTVDGAVARAVGGAVRDTLLGRPVSEIDIAIDVAPDKVLDLAARAGIKAVPTGIDHGTVTLVAGDRPFEVTTLRADVETFGRHAKVEYTGDWEGDARRRDFTINALYADPDGTLFDPLGGLDDVVARRVRFIGEAAERIREDYLRILRYFRFAAELEPDTLDSGDLAACVRERGGLQGLAPERIQHELLRLLKGPGAGTALQAMFDYGLLVDLLGGVVWLTRFERLSAIERRIARAPDPGLRLAALAVAVPEDAERLAGRLRLSNALRDTLDSASRAYDLSAASGEAAAKAMLYRIGERDWPIRVLMAWAQSGAEPGDPAWRNLLDLPGRWTVPKFPLTGSDIIALSIEPGPEVGRIMRALETDWIASGFQSSREAMIERARQELIEGHDDGGSK